MDFTGDGKAKEPVGVGAVAAKRLEKARALQEEVSVSSAKELGHLEEAGTVGLPSRSGSHAGDSAATAANPTPSRDDGERPWFISSSDPYFFHLASLLASLEARRQGILGNIAPWVILQRRVGQKMHVEKTGRQSIHLLLCFLTQLASSSYVSVQHTRQKSIITLVLLHSMLCLHICIDLYLLISPAPVLGHCNIWMNG